MKFRIEYERNDVTRQRIKTTFISRETETDLVIGHFERMHRGRLTVIECIPAETLGQMEARLSAFERDLLPVRKQDTAWQLNRVDDIEWTQDKSGVYVLINWDPQIDLVRLDIMPVLPTPSDVLPLVSFAGRADNVRKATMRWFVENIGAACDLDCPAEQAKRGVSLEHAAYIGAELQCADTERIDYVQD